ncbi:MAG: glycosyltransferase family 1 protein [bacterium]
MKLLDLTNFYGKQSGGVRTYLDKKIEYIGGRDDIEHILIIPGEKDEIVYREKTKIYRLKGLRVPFYPSYRLVINIKNIKRVIEEENPDLVELGDPYTMAFALFATKRRPIIGFYHSDIPGYFKRYFHFRIAEEVGLRYVRWIYNQCDLVLAPSNQTKTKLEVNGIKNIKEVSFGVSNTIFSPEKREEGFRERYGIKDEKIILLYVGRLAKEKHLHILISAFKVVKDKYHLLVVGDGPYKKDMEKALKGKTDVSFLGYTRDQVALAKIYASSDIFVTPSPTETFGITTLEALSSGLPVVGVNQGGLKDIITSDVGLLAEVDDILDFAAKIDYLGDNDPKKMAENAVKKAKEYSWEATFNNLFDIYTKIK